MRWSAALLVAAVVSGCTHRVAGPPDTVVVSARRVYTLDPTRPLAEAVVMRGGRVLVAGSRDEAKRAAGPGAVWEDFPDAVIVPGLVDAHLHLASLGASLALPRLSEARSEADAVARLKRAGAAALQSGWVRGGGWDQATWPGGAWPTRSSLDAAFGDTPVLVAHADGRAAWASSAALAKAGIGAHTKDPPNGRIVRDEGGAPTGVLVGSAVALVARVAPAPSAEERRHHLKLALEACARAGLTQVHDAGMDLATLRLLQTWDLVGALPVRVYAMADGDGDEADEFLGLGRFKGRNLELRSVTLRLDDADDSGGFATHARAFAERGFQVVVYATSERANALAIDTLAALGASTPGGRHRVEHSELLASGDIARLADAGLVASFQPTRATGESHEAGGSPDAPPKTSAWHSALGAGVRLAFGSGAHRGALNPLWGLYAARTRQTRDGQPPGGWAPEQRLTGAEALAAFTTGPAWASFSETRRGVLRGGFDADFTVLSVDPVEGDAARLLSGRILLTVVGGVDVYRAP